TVGGGGAERLLNALVAEGERRGWEQLVLNAFARGVPASFAHLADTDIYRSRRCHRVLELPALRRWVSDELDGFHPDIVHVMLFHALLTVASLPVPTGARRLLTHVYGDGFRTEPYGSIKMRLDRWAGSRFDRTVAISEAVLRFLSSEYRYPPSKLACIPPGWSGDPLPHTGGGDRPTVVCVAKLRPEKGHDLLLAAFALVRQEVPNARLVLVGDGDLRPALESQAHELGLTEAVEFAGAVPSIWTYLAAADVFALASETEAFGMAIVEAMGAGLPVVAPDVGGVPELVVPGVTGELFPPGDHHALAARLIDLLASPERRARMAAAALDKAQPLRMEHTLPRYFALYDELLERDTASER
ncbi:MAG: glycosyltransferase family 4 protein, partial [Actinomycetota bacterium]|nr:glycosyltransferase family 4 protein [Actinomycetota bacterium]